jgi:hypothetical protein
VWTIDHDDGSQRYNDTSNVLAWGGCKNYRGNGKSCDHNLILYPGIDARASGGRRCQTDDNGLFANMYYTSNQCAEADGSFLSFSKCDKSDLNATTYRTAANTYFSDDGSFAPPCGVAGGLKEWQARRYAMLYAMLCHGRRADPLAPGWR